MVNWEIFVGMIIIRFCEMINSEDFMKVINSVDLDLNHTINLEYLNLQAATRD
jgi:hypothetical protein